MNYPIVSIITASFNQGCFIEETIQSVLSQEGDFYLDYIVMDGGSTDNSVEIIKKYAQLLRENKYPLKCKGIEYRWTSGQDRGQSEAINKGFLMAKGEILSFLNSDDLYTAGAIKNVVSQFLENPRIMLVYGDGFSIDEFNKNRRFDNCRGKFNLKSFRKGNTVDQPSVFVRREIIDTVGLLDTNLHFSMDFDWFVRIAHEYKGTYIPLPLSCSRRHGRSKAAKHCLLDLRGAHLSIVRKYGGPRNFALAFGFDILRFAKNNVLGYEESFTPLESPAILDCRQASNGGVESKISVVSRNEKTNSVSQRDKFGRGLKPRPNFLTEFTMLKQAVMQKNKLIDSPITEKEFLDGYAYFFLQDALLYASKDKKRAWRDVVFVVVHTPSLTLSAEFVLAVLKLILPEKLYVYLRNFIRNKCAYALRLINTFFR